MQLISRERGAVAVVAAVSMNAVARSVYAADKAAVDAVCNLFLFE